MKEGWKYMKLGEVCEIERGGSPRPIKDFITTAPDGLNWIKIGDTDPQGKYIYSTKEKIKPTGLKKTRWVEVDDFLLSNSMSFGRPYILKTNGCIHDGWLVLRKYQQYLNADFFYYLLLSSRVQKQFQQKAQGSTVSNLNTQRVSGVEIAFPPLPDQQRIVSYLDAEFAKIEALKANAEKQLQAAKDLFQAALKELLTPKEGWEEKNITQLAENLDSKRIPITSHLRKKGIYPYYGASGIVDYVADYIFDDDLLLISEDGANLLARSTPIAFSVSGKIWVNNHAHIFKFTNMCTQKYVEYYFASINVSEYVTGAAQPKLAQKMLNRIPISIPDNIKEQKAIVSQLDKIYVLCQSLEGNYTETITLCNDLKQAWLKKVVG